MPTELSRGDQRALVSIRVRIALVKVNYRLQYVNMERAHTLEQLGLTAGTAHSGAARLTALRYVLLDQFRDAGLLQKHFKDGNVVVSGQQTVGGLIDQIYEVVRDELHPSTADIEILSLRNNLT